MENRKRSILLVGDDPRGMTGNGHMMHAMLGVLDKEKYQPACYVGGAAMPWDADAFEPHEFNIIQAAEGTDPWGHNKLLRLLDTTKVDVMIMVGIDIWVYATILTKIRELQRSRGFRWIWIFPYDLQELRQDWVEWINAVEVPCVYSKFGYDMLKEAVPRIRYFRPLLDNADRHKPLDAKERSRTQRSLFPSVKEDDFLFGFIGPNQVRKCPQQLIKAFKIVRHEMPEARLYMHTDVNGQAYGSYNLVQYMLDMGLRTGDVLIRNGGYFDEAKMIKVYQSIDCLVNCSMQEGLSWTPLNAMLCGTPVIASETTAQTELVKGAGRLVPCEEPTYLPMYGRKGMSWLDAKCCKPEDIAEAMLDVARLSPEERRDMIDSGLARGKAWLEGVSDINALLDEVISVDIPSTAGQPSKIPAVLFAQHSAGGDVYMTTRCFKGIKERYGGIPLVYMTSPQYMGIVEGNPYLDKVIAWDEQAFRDYQFVLNPHGDRIAPGHWGRNSNSILSDFYWKILDVEPDDFYIALKEPLVKHYVKDGICDLQMPLSECPPEIWPTGNIVVVHTTGGDPQFRTYKYMADVCEGLRDRYVTIQVGGANDYPAGADLDLRGITYHETAWLLDKAVLAVTVDSFMSHLAGGLGISQVCLFGCGNAVVVRPNQVKGQLTCMVPDYTRDCRGLGPCSAAVRDCPTPCTGLHNPEDILKSVKEIESNGMIRRNHEHESSCVVFKYAQ